MIPVALAMACNPQAYLTLDRTQYAPGDSVRVSGSFFKNNAAVTVSVDRTGQSTTVTTTGNGAFQVTFALPSSAPTGGYSVQAIGYEENGDVVAGLPARASFSVAPAQAAAQPSTPSASQSSAPAASQPTASGQPAAAAPQTSSRPAPAQRQPARGPSSGFREPQVFNEPDVQRSRAGSSATSRASAPANAPSAERATSNGRAVFGGSVAVAPSVSTGAPVAATTSPATTARPGGATAGRSSGSSAARGVSPQAAAQTATDDLWGALSADRSPSVLPVAGDGAAVTSPRAGSQLTLGVVLLGAGVLALVGGLAAGELRRRRVRAH